MKTVTFYNTEGRRYEVEYDENAVVSSVPSHQERAEDLMAVSFEEYNAAILMRFDEQLRSAAVHPAARAKVYRYLQTAIEQAMEWKKVADPLVRT